MKNQNQKLILGTTMIIVGFLGLVWMFNTPTNQNETQIKLNESSITSTSSEREKAIANFIISYKDYAYLNDEVPYQNLTSSDRGFQSFLYSILKSSKDSYKSDDAELTSLVTEDLKDYSLENIQKLEVEIQNNKTQILIEWDSFQNLQTLKDAEVLLAEIQNWNLVYSLNPDQTGDWKELKTSFEALIQKIKKPTQTLEPEFNENKEQLEALKKTLNELQVGLKKPEPVVQKVAVQKTEPVVQKPQPKTEKPVQQKPTVGNTSICNGEYTCFVGNSSTGKVHHYIGEELVWTSGKATFGRASAPTEKSDHRIYIKVRNYTLPSYPDYTSSYWIGFNPSGAGSAFHQYWGADDSRLTVGCIKLPETDLVYIWENSSVYQNAKNTGTLVKII